MRIAFFTIPIKTPEAAEAEANRFLGEHRVLAVDRRFVENGENSFWSLAVEYLQGRQEPPAGKPAKGRVDYRDVLSPEEFALFSRLRDLRKRLAEEEAVPLYAVLTNEQLAAIARARPENRAGLVAIDGIGEGRADKYGDRLLAAVEQVST
jgi:superfamily II DNA helicase RecQ